MICNGRLKDVERAGVLITGRIAEKVWLGKGVDEVAMSPICHVANHRGLHYLCIITTKGSPINW